MPNRHHAGAGGAGPFGVAVLGAGTVGSEVVRGLLDDPARLAAGGRTPRLTGVAVRDVARARGRGLPPDVLSDRPAELVADPATELVVEVMGGLEPARTLVASALEAGKPVVTANKHLLARHGAELEALARRTGAALRFEAAVGGGIPVLGPLAGDLAANRFVSVRGIVNGTTNHILSEMAAGRGSYQAVLRSAQEMGYAEADPSADVEGRDAIDKLVILARLAFGEWRSPGDITDRAPTVRGEGRPGITGVTDAELAAAASLGLQLRLIASAAKGRASVVVTALPAASPLGATGGVRNRIEVRGEPVGLVGFDGPGAGGGATSSAVLGDVAAILRGAGSTWAALPAAAAAPSRPGGSLEARCGWFAWLPGATASSIEEEWFVESRIPGDGGIAIRTAPASLEVVREGLATVLPPGVDATLYPIDD
jgi:homoserine dehydrogenase